MRKGSSAAIIGVLCTATLGCGGGQFSDAEDGPAGSESSGTAAPSGGSEGAGGADPTGGAGGDAGGGTGGQAGGPVGPEGCDSGATPDEESCVIDDGLGIFVRTEGDDAAAGTKAAPVRTLAKAVELASTEHKRVYACAQTFLEAVVVPAGVEVYGGLDCATDWSWKAGEVTRIEAPAAIAVRISAASGTARLSDLLITAADASTPSGSSVAVYADGADVDLVRCQLFAGNGAAGSDGAHAPSSPAATGYAGNTGTAACSVYGIAPGGGQKGNATCASSGGAGGAAAVTYGGSGSAGLPSLGGGAGGFGQPASGVWNCYLGQGLDGHDAEPAAGGAKADALGELQAGIGFLGGDGNPGGAGAPGQGGGGGGASRGVCGLYTPTAGAGGGSGGSGGCGGKAGDGGTAGGSSIALAIRTGAVSLNEVGLYAKNGAAGGAAGKGQPGGAGGLGGKGGASAYSTLAGCTGGTGGKGGHGGAGSGAAGGHSAAIVYVGSPPQMEGVTYTLGTAGKGGLGVIANSNGEGGALGGPDGETEELLSL